MANRRGNSGSRDRFYFLELQNTADDDCSYGIKRRLFLGRKAMTNLDSILKNKDITLPTKVRIIKAMVFPVIMYRYERWTIKKTEHWRTDAFKLWCWRRLLRVPWTARSNQSILKEIIPEYALEGLILKLKLQYSGHLMSRADSLEKTLMLRRLKVKGEGVAEDEMVWWHHWFNGHEFEQTLGDSEGQGSLVSCSPCGCKELDTTEQLNNKSLKIKKGFNKS